MLYQQAGGCETCAEYMHNSAIQTCWALCAQVEIHYLPQTGLADFV